MRTRSQGEPKSVFWIAALDQDIDRDVVELHRSQEMIKLKERSAQTRDESALVAEEKRRLSRHEGDLRRRIRQALLGGSIFFRGNDRSPEEGASDIRATTEKVLEQALPEIFDRFHEAAARVARQDLDALMTTENLLGLPLVFTRLNLLHEQNGKPVFVTDSGPPARDPGPDREPCRLWRTRYRPLTHGRVLARALWLGFRCRPAPGRCAPACRQDRGDVARQGHRFRPVARRPQQTAQQQSLPTGVLPPKGRPGLQPGRRGLRSVQGRLWSGNPRNRAEHRGARHP
jgi:hypothetical protein